MGGRIGMAIVGGLLVAACYSPSPSAGLPCSASLECPSGQVCDTSVAPPTCVFMVTDAKHHDDAAIEDADNAPIDAIPIDAPPPGNPPPNDLAPDAVDVAAGGTFLFDITDGHDNYASTCGNGKDVYYKLNLAAPEVIYLDTFGSAANASIIIRTGSCTALTGTPEACVADSCGGTQVQGAWNLPAGEHCIIVDHPGNATGQQKLTVTRGGRAADPLVGASGTVTGNTCNDDNSNNAACGCEPAEDHHYFFTVCPATTVTAEIKTCEAADYDSVLQLRRNGGGNSSLACEDDSGGACTYQADIMATIDMPGLYWAIVDGCNECGPYTMTYSIQ